MRIRKRTPARAASPGPGPSPPLPLTCQLLQPKELPAAEDREEEKQQLAKEEPVGGGEEDDLVVVVMAAASNSNSAAAADGGRCSRNDGKQWRCKSAAVPGHIFCDRHVAWSTRKRNRASKKTISQASPLQPPKTEPQTQQELDNDDKEEPATPAPAPANPRCGGGGIPPGSRKRGRSSGAGPA